MRVPTWLTAPREAEGGSRARSATYVALYRLVVCETVGGGLRHGVTGGTTGSVGCDTQGVLAHNAHCAVLSFCPPYYEKK